jgi:hypothetical protein
MIQRRHRAGHDGGRRWAAFRNVQGGDAIRFCQGWEIEDVINEGIDIAASEKPGFSHMNEFRGAFANDLHTEEALPLGISDEF